MAINDVDIDLSGCEAIGVGGYHSEHYADADDGQCQFCGLRRPPGSETETITLDTRVETGLPGDGSITK
jgi:hypothetical protein